jgi:hypothetical protein
MSTDSRTKLGRNPLELSVENQKAVFPGDAIRSEPGLETGEEIDMKKKSKTKMSPGFRVPRTKAELIGLVSQVREMDTLAVSKKLIPQIDGVSLLNVTRSPKAKSLRSGTWQIGAMKAGAWRVTLLELQVRKTR